MATATSQATKTRFQVRQEERAERIENNERSIKASKKTELVKLRTSLAGKPNAREGEVVSLPDFEARALVQKGYAEEVTR